MRQDEQSEAATKINRFWPTTTRINSFWLPVLIICLSLLPALLGLRAAMPHGVQEDISSFLLRRASLANRASIAFVVVLNLGVWMCSTACIANLAFLFIKGLPIWQKIVTTVFVLLAIFGTLTARSSIRVFQ